MPVRSDQLKEGRYFQGGYSEGTPDTLDWWTAFNFGKSETDVTLTITAKYQYRPDLLAYDAYDKPWLGWFILQYNNIVDVMEEFTVGKTIVLPTKRRLMSELLNRTARSSINRG